MRETCFYWQQVSMKHFAGIIVWVVLYLQMLPTGLSVRESMFKNILNYKCERSLEMS